VFEAGRAARRIQGRHRRARARHQESQAAAPVRTPRRRDKRPRCAHVARAAQGGAAKPAQRRAVRGAREVRRRKPIQCAPAGLASVFAPCYCAP
jgi:hypothetical protein